MRSVRPREVRRSRGAPSVALHDDIAWSVHAGSAAGARDGQGSDRLAWPTAIAVTVSLSAGLWLGIAWLVRLTLG